MGRTLLLLQHYLPRVALQHRRIGVDDAHPLGERLRVGEERCERLATRLHPTL